jgi:hypothetical protein
MPSKLSRLLVSVCINWHCRLCTDIIGPRVPTSFGGERHCLRTPRGGHSSNPYACASYREALPAWGRVVRGCNLAAMDDSNVGRVMAANGKSIVEAHPQFAGDRLWQFIRTARAKGYSVNPGLVFPEAWGIAVAVLDDRRQPIRPLNIGVIASRMQEDRHAKLAAVLKAEALALSKQLRNWRSSLAA